MPYQVRYSENPFGVITKFFGVVTDEDLHKSCVDRTLSEEQVKDLSYVLDDFVEVSEFLVTSEGVIDAASFAIKAAELNKHLQYLSVVPADLLYGTARMWFAHTDETEWERNIFRTREEAEKWLEANVY